jgi:hypothetical protein
MYTNIPKIDTLNIINNILKNNSAINKNNREEIVHILQVIVDQNYFQIDKQYYKQTDGLAMGAPTSAILAQTYLQHMEHEQIYPILIKQQIIGYFRYVDDILIIYDQNKTNIKHTLNEFNKLQSSIKFTMEKEIHYSINVLDLTIHREEENLKFTIYRKPTQTDIIIPSSSCHPNEHKRASINYLLNRMHEYTINKEGKEAELNIIKNILQNNEYSVNIANTLHLRKHTKTPTTKRQNGPPSHIVEKK